VCDACRSTVVRELDSLVVAGRVSAFSRDLSPVQLGARGNVDGRDFQVVGVLRKAREDVRWNEWYLSFSDGTDGWLGEGHGFFQIFPDRPVPVDVRPERLGPGGRAELGGITWHVIEVATARVVAADGTLPFAAVQDTPTPYADLRSVDGSKVGTLDAEDTPPSLWAGRIVALTALQMEGLRALHGWVDPVLSSFAGPEVTAVRTLGCPACGASLTLRAPGSAVRMGCEYCGSELALDEVSDSTTASVLEAREAQVFKLRLPLGTRGELEGVQWEVIGAMDRYVVVDYIEYHWTEYFLYNPYRGFRWLVEDGRGHWSYVKPMPSVPASAGGRRARFKGRTYRHYQGGQAVVAKVKGEFNWEVRVGDRAGTDDFVAPPYMLSIERTGEEVNWSHGEYKTPDEIAEAFGVRLGRAAGICPHAPNPYDRPEQSRRAWTFTTLLLLGAVGLFLFQAVTAADDVISSSSWSTSGQGEEVFLTEPFEVPDTRRKNLYVEVESQLGRTEAQVQVALMNTSDGSTYLPLSTSDGNNASGRLYDVTPGPYVGRVEVARNPKVPPLAGLKSIQLLVVHDRPWRSPIFLLAFYAVLAPLALMMAKGAFETRRWSESDHAG